MKFVTVIRIKLVTVISIKFLPVSQIKSEPATSAKLPMPITGLVSDNVHGNGRALDTEVCSQQFRHQRVCQCLRIILRHIHRPYLLVGAVFHVTGPRQWDPGDAVRTGGLASEGV